MEAQIISERFKYSSKNNIKKMNFKQLEFKKEFEIFLFSSVLEKFVCQMCGEDELKIIGEIDRYGFYYPTGICNSCGHIQQKYYYNQKLLDLFYQKYYGVIYRNDINPERQFENGIQKTRIYYEILEKHVY